MFLRRMFSRRWFSATIFVVAGTVILIRLGIWQLDRLESRRAAILHFHEVWSMPTLDFNSSVPETILEMEYRAVKVSGEYDFDNQIAIRNQYFNDQYGYHLLTPLQFSGKAVFVDRGWIPADSNDSASEWRKYDEPRAVEVSVWIRLGQGKPAFGGVDDVLPAGGSRLEIWNNADVETIAGQVPYPMLPIYIQPNADANDVTPPIPVQPEVDLTEGPHLGYALQWFIFAGLLFFGYPFFLKRQDSQNA